MAALANLLSNAFQLPVQQQQAQAQPQAPEGMGSPMEGIQHIEGITNEYYTKWSEAQNFAHEMNAIGIDVTKPDFRSQESRDAGNLYRKMIADLKYKGNELTNSQKMLEKFASARLSSYGADIGYSGDEQKPFDIYKAEHTGITSREKDAAIGGRLDQQLDATAANTDKRIAANALQGDLNRAVQLRIAENRTAAARDKVTRQIEPYETLHNAAIDLVGGNVKWKPSTKLTPTGRQYQETNFWGGSKYGKYEDVQERKDKDGKVISTTVRTKDRIIRGGLYDAETGEIFIEFKDGGIEQVDQNSLAGMVTKYAESNSGYKAADAQVFVGMIEPIEDFPKPDIGEYGQEQNKAVYDESQKDLKKLQSINRGGATPTYELDDGTKLEMHRETRSWHGLNTTAGTDIKINGGENLGIDPETKYSEEEAIQVLHDVGYYTGTKFYPKGAAAPTAAPKAAPASAPIGDGGIAADYKTPEYQAKLKQQLGWLTEPETRDNMVEQFADDNNEDFELVNEAVNIYLELGAEQMFQDWWAAGGRQAAIDNTTQTSATQGDPTKL